MIRFVHVNGRTPRRGGYCALCGDKIEVNYVREISTGLCYCDGVCYVDSPTLPWPALEYLAALPPCLPPSTTAKQSGQIVKFVDYSVIRA
jgi:hypothetical protein